MTDTPPPANGWPAAPGVPPDPERDGWHWLAPVGVPNARPGPYRWYAPPRPDVVGNWNGWHPLDMVRRGYGYVGIALTPAEVAAREAAAEARGRVEGRTEMRERAVTLCRERAERLFKEYRAGLKADSRLEALSDGADDCADAIRALAVEDASDAG